MSKPPEEQPPEDRMADGYEPRFDLDHAVGKQGELFVSEILAALQSERVEVKTDLKASRYGNVFLEYECLRRGRYQPSGIATTDAKLWVFVLDLGNVAVAVSTDRLRELGRLAYRHGRTRECVRGSHPTRGVVIKVADLMDGGTTARKGTGN